MTGPIPQLTDYDLTRYNRQMLMPEWGEAGQAKLKGATVFIAGAGGGAIRVCDADPGDLSNLNRQFLHTEARLGVPKAESGGRMLQARNEAIRIVPLHARLGEESAEGLIGRPNIVVDCLDNYEARYLLNRYCIQHHIPLVHGAIWGWTGQVTFISPPETPCLRCLTPEAPPKGTFPVVGATPGLAGSIQAMEVLKYLTGIGANLKGKLLTFDGEDMNFMTLNIYRAAACPECGHLG